MHLICPLIIQILLASAYGGDVSKVPSIRAINWSIVKFAFQQLEGGVTCNTIIYSCLCGSLLESVQEGNGENDI